MIASRSSALAIAAMSGLFAATSAHAQVPWWRGQPVDFEECADTAEKATTKEAKTFALAECNAKFAGRRKPGGGYTYYDFMQDRTFDIAGPNPTPEEQKKIDEQYTLYLEKQRRESIAQAFIVKQQQQKQQAQQVALRTESEKVPVPVASPLRSQSATGDPRPRMRNANCAKGSFSCEWPRLSQGIDELKKLFGSPSSKAKRS